MKLHSISFHNMRRRKSKAIGILLILTLAVTLTVALTILARTTEEELQNSFDKVGSNMVIVPKTQDLTLSYNGVTVPGITLAVQEMDEKNIELIHTIKNSESIAFVAPKLIGSTNVNGQAALVVGADLKQELGMKAWWNLTGGVPAKTLAKNISDQDVIVGSEAAAKLNIKAGDKVTIDNETYTAKAVLESLGSEEDNVIFLDLHKAQNILDKPGKVSFIEVAALCYTCPIEDIVEQVSHVLPDTKVTALIKSLEQRKQTVERFSDTARAVAVAILILGVLITANTIAAAVSERRREIGIFRAIGFRKSHIARIIFTEITVSALGAAIIGGLLGAGISLVIAPVIMDLPLQVKFLTEDAYMALGVSGATAFLAALYPLLKVMRLNPADALRTI